VEIKCFRFRIHTTTKRRILIIRWAGAHPSIRHSATRGLLRRAHIIAGKHRRIGKESDRRWEEGAELESLSYVPIEFEPPGGEQKPKQLVRASESLIRKIKRIGIRELMRSGMGRRILEKICRRQHVNADTLREYEGRIRLNGSL
jgi:hypothetical protein